MENNFLTDFKPTGLLFEDITRYLMLYNLPKTATHCAAVATRAKDLAWKFGSDPYKAEQAGYLHDISAVVPDNKRIEFARSQGVEVLAEELQFPMIIHQKLSAVLAREIFDISDLEILGAIGCHTTLKAGASDLDKVVFLADKIAWDQSGAPPYIENLSRALKESLDAAVLVYLNFLWNRRGQLRVVHPWLIEAKKELLKEV
jgi:predicted HD superfamily hydrolase involved in NAD metabolism